jgi:hypothetical protein
VVLALVLLALVLLALVLLLLVLLLLLLLLLPGWGGYCWRASRRRRLRPLLPACRASHPR